MSLNLYGCFILIPGSAAQIWLRLQEGILQIPFGRLENDLLLAVNSIEGKKEGFLLKQQKKKNSISIPLIT